MKFCDNCGSYMKKTKRGYFCRKCGNVVQASTGTQPTGVKRTNDSSVVHVVNDSRHEYVKVSQVCPKCGNNEAFRWFSRVSGEHAGIRRERTIEHFKCTRCSHLWTKT